MFNSFFNWIKDPFNKQAITKHNEYLHQFHEMQRQAQRTNQKVLTTKSKRAAPRVKGGANAIDRSILGTYQRARKQHYDDDNCD